MKPTDEDFNELYHETDTESMDQYETAKYFYELGKNSKNTQ